jgi:DNA-binding CsgD family transcriptional regulator/PAS domain-containing protein
LYNNVEETFSGSTALLSLIELIYAAVDDGSLWDTVMDRVAEVVNGQWTLIWGSFDNPAATDITAWARLDPTVLAAYVEHYASVNVISQGIEQFCPNDLVTFSHQVISDSDFEQSEYYNDYFRPNGVFYALGMKIDLSLKAPAFISSVRPKTSGPFDDREGLVFETLLPHLQRSMKLHLELSRLHSNVQGLEAALDSFGIAVIGLDTTGTVVLMNQAADQLVKANEGIRLSKRRLVSDDLKHNSALQLLVSDAVSLRTTLVPKRVGALLISRKSHKPAFQVTFTPVPLALIQTHKQLATLVFITDPARGPLSRSSALRALYGLSPLECRLADLLASGHDVAAAAKPLRLTVDATRSHLKSVYRKTGTNRQADLIRCILGLPGIV